MKSLVTGLVAALFLAGCGMQPSTAPRLASAQAPAAASAASSHETQQLYGIFVVGTVEKATHKTENGYRVVTATLRLLEAENTFDGSKVSGRVTVNVMPGLHGEKLDAVKPGAKVQAFINYPLIDRVTHTIVPQARPYQASLSER